MSDKKRLFFGFRVSSPWPEDFPNGRVLDPENRHLTLAFLGNLPYEKFKPLISSIPVPAFRTGPVAVFDQCQFFPKDHPHVVAWHVKWLEDVERIQSYQAQLIEWLVLNDLIERQIDKPFHPHVTIARGDFDPAKWKSSFEKLPLFIEGIDLFESLGHSQYESLWKLDFVRPFEELEHTADLAFRVRGETFQDLFFHAQMALFFSFPSLLPYLTLSEVNTLDDGIVGLNEIVTNADMEIGSPLKAVSFHADIFKRQDNLLEWEMILDV